jgi:hypothetical protein
MVHEVGMRTGRTMKLAQRVGLLCAVALLSAPAPVSAQGRDSVFDAATTARVIDSVASVFAGCRDIPDVYRPDCLGKALQSGASKISNNPAYWEAYVALTRLSRGLTEAVRENRDDRADRLRAGGVRLDAVNPAALPALAAETRAAIARASEDLQRLSASEVEAFAPLRELLLNARPWP